MNFGQKNPRTSLAPQGAQCGVWVFNLWTRFALKQYPHAYLDRQESRSFITHWFLLRPSQHGYSHWKVFHAFASRPLTISRLTWRTQLALATYKLGEARTITPEILHTWTSSVFSAMADIKATHDQRIRSWRESLWAIRAKEQSGVLHSIVFK